MTITADSQQRAVLPFAKPGETFECEQRDENHITLVRRPAPAKKKTPAEIRQAILNSKMKFDMTWDELRQLTREP